MKSNFDRDDLTSSLEIPFVIPEFINARIDDTLRILEKKKNRRLSKKSFVILTACIIISSYGTLVAFGQNLTIPDFILSIVNPFAAKNYEAVKVAIPDNRGKTVVNKKATDQGITITINDLSYDGSFLIVGFNVIMDEGFGSDVTEIEAYLDAIFQSPTDSSRRGNNVSVIDSHLLKKDNGCYQGYASFYFEDPESKIQENYTLSIGTGNIRVYRPSGFTEVIGSWKIDTGMTEKEIYTPAQTKESNIIHELKNGQVNSVKIIRSALSNIIILKGMSKDCEEFFILDDKGNCLNYEYILQRNERFRDFNTAISLLRIPDDTQKVTIVPYTFVNSKENSDKEKSYSVDITKVPVSIKIQDLEINISDIERCQGKLILHYTVSGLTDDREINFHFEDKDGNEIEPIEPYTRMPNGMDYETQQGTYEIKTEHPEEISKVIIYGHEYELNNDYKFDVELK